MNFFKPFRNMIDEMEKTFGEEPFKHFTQGSSVSVSQINHNGKQIEVKTVNGKTTVKVNGVEYVAKGKDK
jgi:hypothetical protein